MTKATLDVELLLETLCRNTKTMIKQRNLTDPYIIGIRTGGVWLAEHLAQYLAIDAPVGVLDISFYRDDFSQQGLNTKAGASSLPLPTEGRNILLVDDVLMTGRTIRGAMNELFDFGRPNSISLLTLVDIGERELPIQADVIGGTLQLAANEQVKLNGPAPLSLSISERE